MSIAIHKLQFAVIIIFLLLRCLVALPLHFDDDDDDDDDSGQMQCCCDLMLNEDSIYRSWI